jgi:hypothetical protein
MARYDMFCMMIEERLLRVIRWLAAAGAHAAPEEYLPGSPRGVGMVFRYTPEQTGPGTAGTAQRGTPEQSDFAAHWEAVRELSRWPQTADEAMALEYFSLKAMIMDDPTILSMCPRARWLFSRLGEIEQAGALGRLATEFQRSFGSPSIPSQPGRGTGSPGGASSSGR